MFKTISIGRSIQPGKSGGKERLNCLPLRWIFILDGCKIAGMRLIIYISVLFVSLSYFASCASAPGRIREESRVQALPEAGRVQATLAEGAGYVLGKESLNIRGKKFALDCTGVVLAIYYYAGLDLAGDFPKYSGNGVTRLYKSLEQEKLLYNTNQPETGDIIFWDNTYDRNKDGRLNDTLTHVAMVVTSKKDGTIEYIHHNYRKGIIIEYMNLLNPDVFQKLDRGEMRIINSPMRMKTAGKSHGEKWLSSQLYKIFGRGYLLTP